MRERDLETEIAQQVRHLRCLHRGLNSPKVASYLVDLAHFISSAIANDELAENPGGDECLPGFFLFEPAKIGDGFGAPGLRYTADWISRHFQTTLA